LRGFQSRVYEIQPVQRRLSFNSLTYVTLNRAGNERDLRSICQSIAEV